MASTGVPTPNIGLNQWQATDKPERLDFNGDNAKVDTAVGEIRTELQQKASEEFVATQLGNVAATAIHSKTGTVHSLTLQVIPASGIQMVQFVATAVYTEGDTWTINELGYAAKLQGERGALPDNYFVVGDLVSALLDPAGKRLGFKSGGTSAIPSIFGNGSDGDLVVAAGETVVLPVAVPHQSIVEMQYRSILIEAGGTLKCSHHNAGLILRCKGSCTINGTIDQSLMAPKTNPNNNYPYPAELVCGAGGGGVKGMPQRPYGGGYGAGGNGGGTERYGGGQSGSTTDITVTVPNIFIGGTGQVNSSGVAGAYGGGGGGGYGTSNSNGGTGGNGAGGVGTNGRQGSDTSSAVGGGGGGGAGNYGGGVILLYAQGATQIVGNLLCNGANGGSGGRGGEGERGIRGGDGQAGCGGGGGAVYIVYGSTILNTGNMNVNGGTGSQAGIIGTVTVKKYEEVSMSTNTMQLRRITELQTELHELRTKLSLLEEV